jgi:hypothetical protein
MMAWSWSNTQAYRHVVSLSASRNEQHLSYADGSPLLRTFFENILLLFNVHNRRRREGFLAYFESKVIRFPSSDRPLFIVNDHACRTDGPGNRIDRASKDPTRWKRNDKRACMERVHLFQRGKRNVQTTNPSIETPEIQESVLYSQLHGHGLCILISRCSSESHLCTH